MNDTLQGALIGTGSTLLGFLLTMWRDWYKYRRDQRERDAALKRLLSEELLVGMEIMAKNHRLLHEEMGVLNNDVTDIRPLLLLPASAWPLLCVNLPKEFAKAPALLAQIRSVSLAANEINETVRSRQSFRITGQGLTTFADGMRMYDELLLFDGERYVEQVRALAPKLQISLPDTQVIAS